MSNIEIKQLSEKQYLQTMSSGMKNITKVAESLVDIWNYAEYLLQNNLLSEYGFQMRLIEAVYVNSENTYQHIFLSTYQKNLYVVIVVDVINKTILGHYILDLNEKYGLNN